METTPPPKPPNTPKKGQTQGEASNRFQVLGKIPNPSIGVSYARSLLNETPQIAHDEF